MLCIHIRTFCVPHTPMNHFSSYFIATFSFLASLLHKWCTYFPYPIRYGPQNGSGQVATSDFIFALAVGDPKNGRGYVALGSKKGEVTLPDGGFLRRKHGIKPYWKPKNEEHQDGKPSTTMGTPSFGAVESIRFPNCTPRMCTTTRAQNYRLTRSSLSSTGSHVVNISMCKEFFCSGVYFLDSVC